MHVSANDSGDSNHNAATQVTQNVAVGTKGLTVVAGSGTITYGGSFTPSFTPTGLVGTDAISSVTYI